MPGQSSSMTAKPIVHRIAPVANAGSWPVLCGNGTHKNVTWIADAAAKAAILSPGQ